MDMVGSELELLGFAEVAELLHTSPRQLLRWTQREDFPEPLVRLRATPVWRKRDIERWAKQRPTRRMKA